ncbi:RNA polymerase sigma factor [Pararcticibacter amylolyticus]|uniref:RNA polymerase subunit sigma-70 n=1 Tax=Pararcticibacter amylolyticus TaxID=2173175 RepID=A0A2U2PCR2_9SPHI|nr:RNA polymerase sigma-70 factor [Pararcticibacter amylolyticus]PWG79177.1 RNA polymerase subunit sigma-70 [Pararcticibacter amylolyticus]
MAEYQTLSDVELAALLKAGDHAAFTEIYERYASLVINFTVKRLHDIAAAKDIVQDVFVALWNYRQTFELKVSLSAYLYRAALNRMLDQLKHEQVKTKHLESLKEFVSIGWEGTDHLARSYNFAAIIEREISALPPRTREIFELRRKQHLSNREIAEKLDLSEQTVETHMKRARKQLRTRLGLFVYLLYLIMY